MDSVHGYLVAALSVQQHAMGVFGSVGEIGVYTGLFFLALAHTAVAGERLFACDMWSSQNQYDNGLSEFDHNKIGFGVRARIQLFMGSSSKLTLAILWEMGLVPFRLLSVDGGHSLEQTLHDLRLAASVAAAGGIVVLDDVDNPAEMEVKEGLYRFLCPSQRRGSSF